MSTNPERDYIIVEDENGNEKKFGVEALFDLEDQTYALLTSEENRDDTIVVQVEDEEDGQYLIGIDDPEKREMVLEAYEIAVNANPAE